MPPDKLVGLILRHGETAANASGAFRSWIDFPLTAKGEQQAKDAAEFLKKYPLQKVICSPLLRAFVTACDSAFPHNLFVYQHRGLFPWRLGSFSGQNRDEVQDAFHLYVDNPEVAIPGHGESLNDFTDRQFAFWQAALKDAQRDGLTLFVAHTSNCVALCNFCDPDGDQVEPETGDTVQPGGIAGIFFDGKNHRVEVLFGAAKPAEFGGS